MGFLLRAVGRKITKALNEAAQTPEGQAVLERAKRERAVQRIVDQLAASGLDDETACAQLRERLPGDREASLNDAYAYLLSLQPRLSELPARERPDPSAKGWSFSRGGRSPFEFVGPAAESHHAVLNTDLAVNIVSEYTRATRVGRLPDADPTPFFERRRHSFSGTFSLFGKGPKRPRASNQGRLASANDDRRFLL
jgi:hypothetical protein